MIVPRVLFIPDRFMDYRMWADIPNRLKGRAEIVHFDQHERIPWDEDSEEFIAAVGRLAAVETFSIAAAAGQAARFGFAMVEAGLAKALVLFQPSFDRLPDEINTDLSGLNEMIAPYRPIVGALDVSDPDTRREILLSVLRETAGQQLEPADLASALSMFSDHADEFFADLKRIADAAADGRTLPDPPWVEHPWLDRLSDLTAPVIVVTPSDGPVWEAIARRAQDAELAVAAGTGLAPAGHRARAAEALLRTLDRIR